MKSLTSGPRSVRIEVTLCALCIAASIVSCQGNSSTPSSETTSAVTASAITTSAVTTTQPNTEIPKPEVLSAASVPVPPVSSVATTETTAVLPKPEEATTGAKTPRPKNSTATGLNEPNAPSSSAVSVAPAAPPDTPIVEKPCSASSFDFPAVESACEKGGVPKAKALMKSWVNKAKEKGESYKCTSCHDNQRTYSNKPNAVADLRKLLNIIK